MMKPVYLDVDTGIDDALAILLAVEHPALDVRGITTVDGNVDLEQVTRNTLQVLDVAGAYDVPVVSGASHALAGPSEESASAVHGNDGLGGANLPAPSREAAGADAVAFLRDELLAADTPATLIALAPLTNIANLLEEAPEVTPKIERIAVMGGSVGPGNATPVAEFNIYHDPEAADVVFSAGVPILMYGLDVFYKVRFTRHEVSQWFGAGANGRADLADMGVRGLAAHLLHFAMDNFGVEDASIGDAGCVACVIDESGLTTQRLPVVIETEGRYCRGQTVVDRRPGAIQRLNRSAEEYSPVDVGLEIDVEFYRTMFKKTIRGES